MISAQVNYRAAPFDALAETYDRVFTFSRIGQAQRSATWKEMIRTFREGDRVLEIGCGTGIDACFLADHGVKILACDNSSAMIRVAKLRVRDRQSSVDLRVLSAEELDVLCGEAPFDGVVSNFGALNCVAELSSVVRVIGRLVRPGGKLLVCLLGRFCLWETVWYLLRFEPQKAFRRLRRGGVTTEFSKNLPLHVTYHTARQLEYLFAPEFRLRSWQGVGLFVPPSYAGLLVDRYPKLLQLLEWVDSFAARSPIFRGLSDHILLQFERVSP